MTFFETALLYTAVVLMVQWMYQIWDQTTRHLAPGPMEFPIIGNLWQAWKADPKYHHKALYKLSKVYGNVMTLKLGMVNEVAINGYDAIKSVLNNDEFLNRMDADWLLHKSFGKKIGLVSGSADYWKPTRRFTMFHLREFGFGKRYFQQSFLDTEIDEISKIFDQAIAQNDGRIQPNKLFGIPTVNVVWASVANSRFDYDDVRITKLVHLMSEWSSNAKLFEGIPSAFPVLLKWFPQIFSTENLQKIDFEMQGFLRSLINEIRDQGTFQMEPKSFIESFLQNMESDSSKKREFQHVLTEENLISILYDLFLGGSQTTSATMSFALLWLAMYPEIQERIRNELTAVIGNDRRATLEDKSRLPYTRAFILELHRTSCIVPLMPRKVFKDTKFEKFVIPANTLVMLNPYSILMDEEFWGDPENFRPSRFLDQNNNIINSDRVMTFGGGRRNCVGETIAEGTIFAFVTHLVQKYQFLPAQLGQKFDTSSIVGISSSPHLYTIQVAKRDVY
ncbi:unnamed protein product [Allacma fusca]|uniref:Cytochrome P450 n=1 Tax=Allacma fusca TaxID=39272 RepID=A0A8J2KRX7_9HEXA|nr:unnamed protein product [Allacma fusca]